jgi:phosphatidylglycerol:prolipoprotein diacylglycerol transferase
VVPFASFMIRFGNLMNSEIVGEPTQVPWAFIFPTVDLLPRHPTQIYEALFYVFLFLVMYWLWKNKRDQFGKGFMFGLFCVLMFTFRFLMEFLKENQESFEASLPINMGQILSIPFVLIGIFMMWKSFQTKKIA